VIQASRSPSFNERIDSNPHTLPCAFPTARQAGITWGSEALLDVLAEPSGQRTYALFILMRPEFSAAIEGELVMLTGRGMED